MKRGLLILLSVIIMTLCGCSSKDSDAPAGDKLTQKESGTSGVIDEEETTTDVDAVKEETETTDYETSEVVSDNETTEAEQIVNTTNEPASETAVETTTAKKTESVTQKPMETQPPTTTQAQTTTQAPTTTQLPTTTVVETTTELPTYDICSEVYAEEVKKYALQYINELRVSEGNVELTNASFIALYSQGRSTQLVTNFAHDTLDERAMAMQLKYGRYINPVEYGIEGEPYYEPYGQEAIGKLGISKHVSPEAMGKKIANGMYNSKGHWNYVGGTLEFYKDYIYSGIGVTCDGDYLYVCITVDTIKWE